MSDGPELLGLHGTDGVTRPSDLLFYYLTPRGGVGQVMRLETIDRKLSKLPLDPVLHLLSQVAAEADRSINDREAKLKLARNLFPKPLVGRAVDRLKRDPSAAPVSSQAVLHLACRALVSCNPDRSTAPADVDALERTLGGLLLAVADHLVRNRNTDPKLHLELLRGGLFYRLNDLSAWYGAAERLLFEVLPSMPDDPDYIDIAALVERAYGLDLDLLWSLTAAYGLAAREDPNFFELPDSIDGDHVTDAERASWLAVWAIDIAEARALAANDLASGSWWSFTALYDKPVLARPPRRSLVIRPAFLAAKATPGGMFWPIRHALVSTGGTHQQWAQFFGRAIEELGRRYLREMPTQLDLIEPEHEIRKRWGEGRCCDAVLVGGSWVALDFVNHQITRDTAVTGNLDNLTQDLERAILDKLDQVDATLHRGLAVEGSPSAMYPMVVMGSPMPLNPLLISTIADLFAARRPQVIGIHDSCRQPALLDLAEFACLPHILEATGTSLPSLLEGWLSSGLAGNNFRDWLVTDGPGRALRGGGSPLGNWQGRLTRRLFGRPADQVDP